MNKPPSITCAVVWRPLLLAILMTAAPLQAQVTWIGDVLIDDKGCDEWTCCSTCFPPPPDMDPDTNWSNNRFPGFDGPGGDVGADAVIPPDAGVIRIVGGTIDLNSLSAQGGLEVNGNLRISGTGNITALELTSGGQLTADGAVTLNGSSTWVGAFQGGGSITNSGTLNATTGPLRTTLNNEATLIVSPSLNFGGGPGVLVNGSSGEILLPEGGNILDGSSSGTLFNSGTIRKTGPALGPSDLSVIEAAGEHAGGSIIVEINNTLRFFRNGWRFTGGEVQMQLDAVMELAGNVMHEFDGTSPVMGGTLLFNMATFGEAVVTSIVVVQGNLAISGTGVRIDDILTASSSGYWDRGTISGTGHLAILNSDLSPFQIVEGGSKQLTGRFENLGVTRMLDTVSIASGGELLTESLATDAVLIIDGQGSVNSVDFEGNGLLTNKAEMQVVDAFSTIRVVFDQAESADLRINNSELTLRGGGTWTGQTQTLIEGADEGGNDLHFAQGTYEFGPPGQHSITALTGADVLINGATLIASAPLGFGNNFTPESEIVMQSGAIGGAAPIRSFANAFTWSGGTFGVDGQIDFINGFGATMAISSGIKNLQENLTNQGTVFAGGVNLQPNAEIRNSGTWRHSDGHLIGTGLFTNTGEFRAEPFAGVTVSCSFDNTGLVSVDLGTLTFSGPVSQISDGVLTGGTWVVGPDGTLVLPGPLTTVGSGAVVSGIQDVNGFDLNEIDGGDVTVTDNLPLNGALQLANGGRLMITGNTQLSAPQGISNGNSTSNFDFLASVSPSAGRRGMGPLIVTPLLDNWARLSPGGEVQPGELAITGDLIMQPTATLEIDLGGSLPVVDYDQLNVDGVVELDGTLMVGVVDGFLPSVGQQFTVVTARSGLVGAFANLDSLNTPSSVDFSLVQTATQIVLVVEAVEDVFGDGFESD